MQFLQSRMKKMFSSKSKLFSILADLNGKFIYGGEFGALFSGDILAVKNGRLWTVYIPDTEFSRLNEDGRAVFLQKEKVARYLQECERAMACYGELCGRIACFRGDSTLYYENIVNNYYRAYSQLMAQYRLTNLEVTALLADTPYVEALTQIRWSMRKCFMRGNEQFYDFLRDAAGLQNFDELIPYMTPDDVLRCVSPADQLRICEIHEVRSGSSGMELISYSDVQPACTLSAAPKHHCVKGHNVSRTAKVRGKAIVLKDGTLTDSDRAMLRSERCILVTVSLHFDLTEYWQNIIGLVCDEGGVMSHAAILAREYSLPCITETQNGTAVFQTGDWVELNTSAETLKRCDE